MKNIILPFSIMGVFIFAYLSGMIIMANKKISIADLVKSYTIYKGNGKLFLIFYVLGFVSAIIACLSNNLN